MLLLATLSASAATADPAALYAIEVRRLSGGVERLERYRGDVLLIVNTASRCGYTPQYEGLQALHERYHARGLRVLGFPSNDFAGQEPGSDREIGAFCRANYGVAFPMFSKLRVRGDDAHPLYALLTGLPAPVGGPVQWNFQKYLADRDGRVVARFAPAVEPDAPALVGQIERLLAQPPAAGAPRHSPRQFAKKVTVAGQSLSRRRSAERRLFHASQTLVLRHSLAATTESSLNPLPSGIPEGS
jgi:glutathione peroxidase